MNILIGNIFDSNAKTLVNTVNCVGVMGKGIALEFKKRYPGMFEEYALACENGFVRPGKPYLYTDLAGASVLNFPTKDNWRSPSKVSYIREGLQWFRNNYRQLGITSIAFPPLGCGNGGLDWETVGPLMYKYLYDLPIDIEIYAPFGTAKSKLTVEYLSRISDTSKETLGVNLQRINNRWLLILEVVKEINNQRYALHVGRVIFQKICFVLTHLGVQTGFSFRKASYGPYSADVKQAITILSNAGLMIECQSPGQQMVETHAAKGFVLEQDLYTAQELEWTKRTVDLFRRVKNTDHAEMIATILYAYDDLKGEKPTSEEDIYIYVTNWKKRWAGERDSDIKQTIRDLSMLQWIDPTISYETIEEY